jgi:hypothetical protein
MGDPFEKGDPIAIEYAMSKARGRLKTARSRKLGTSVYLSNNAYHDEPYAWDIEDGNIKFRPENPNASHVVERAARKTAAEFATITKSKLALLRGIGA